jgi:dipeptidyl aminopeptidase/acylaminoacyl peptidase
MCRATNRLRPPAALLAATLVLLTAATAPAEAERVTKPDYKQASRYGDSFLRQFVYDTAVTPRWIGKTDSFWYQYRTSKGTQFWRVDPVEGRKKPLFDAAKLGTLLSELLRKPVDPALLPLTRVSINEDGTRIKFVVEDMQYEYDLQAEKLARLGKAPPETRGFPGRGGRTRQRDERERTDPPSEEYEMEVDEEAQEGDKPGTAPRQGDYRAFSPDRKAYVFARKHNLYLVEDGKEEAAVPLSADGVEGYSFGGGEDDRKARPSVTWSADSKAFYVTRGDSRGVKELYLVNSLAEPRPTLEKYRYSMPGEDGVRKSELYVCDRAVKRLVPVKAKWKDESYSNVHWGKAPGELRFARRDRFQRQVELCSLNTATGEATCLIAEGFENANVAFLPVQYLDETDEMVWWSERSGWGHFYLYGRDGKLKNAITSGPCRASRVVAVDAKARVLWFQGNAREPGENVYYQHLYRVGLDGKGLELLDPGDADHRSTLSPSRRFLVDNASRVDRAPHSVLRDAAGNMVLQLEEADLSRLREVGWKMPETFTVKAADGVTDLYGNMWKPFDFDPKKKYPVIAHVYPGPQQEGVTHTFSATGSNQQLAQLGFIVIQVGHRGGTPTRSKAYHSFGYNNLRDYGLADKKAAIEQLAARHAFIDGERVGIYGHSGGGFMSAAALLQKPYNEFFKAAVASAGNHDNNIYNNGWAERYHGLREVVVNKKEDVKVGAADKKEDATEREGRDEPPQQKEETKTEKKEEPPLTKLEIKVPTNAELAANLKGALLLVHGEIDNNVHPANTMRLVDALIKANKRFDMLILPGKRHGFGDYQPYFQQRMWEFFAAHLMGDRPTGADLYEKNGR